MNTSTRFRNTILAILPLLIFGFAYRIRADQKRTLLCRSSINALAFVPNSDQLAVSTGTMGAFEFWDVPSRKLILQGQRYSACRVEDQFFKNGEFLAHFTLDYKMETRDTRTGKLVRTLDCTKELNARYQRFEELRAGYLSNDGKILALATWTPPNSGKILSNSKLRLWNLQTHQPICVIQATALPQNLQLDQYYHSSTIRAVRFAPDDKSVAIGFDRGEISLWSVPDGQLQHQLSGAQNAVVALAFSPDGTRLASGSISPNFVRSENSVESLRNSIAVWDVRQGALLRALDTGVETETLAFSPDGKLLASGDAQGEAALWDAATGQLKRTLNGHNKAIAGLDFSPDGKTLATGSQDKKIKLWQIN